jgi:hypothetical protein
MVQSTGASGSFMAKRKAKRRKEGQCTLLQLWVCTGAHVLAGCESATEGRRLLLLLGRLAFGTLCCFGWHPSAIAAGPLPGTVLAAPARHEPGEEGQRLPARPVAAGNLAPRIAPRRWQAAGRLAVCCARFGRPEANGKRCSVCAAASCRPMTTIRLPRCICDLGGCFLGAGCVILGKRFID